MIDPELPYWMALAHMGQWKTEKINQLAVSILTSHKLGLAEFMDLNPYNWAHDFNLLEADIQKLQNVKEELPNYSFLAENMLEQGFRIIPLNSQNYSQTLKNNLKLKYSPPVLYVKGNTELLQMGSVAIVGSRNAPQQALEFTETRARMAVENNQLIVSGFAPGIDQHALESALKYKGKSIIVIPQGVLAFKSGFNSYYQQIWEGDVLVLSTFHPKARWTAQLAMSRNPVIYGLADEIYIADCQEKSGTWAGATDGLRKGRIIYIRKPRAEEKNAHNLLIDRGAKPIDSGYRVISELPLRVSEVKKADYSTATNSVQSPSQLPLI